MRNKFIDTIHLITVLILITSFLWLDWKLVAAGVIMFWLQLIIFGNCILTLLQYRKNKSTSYIINKINIGLKFFNRKKISVKKNRYYIGILLPIIIFLLSYLLQETFGITPIIRL